MANSFDIGITAWSPLGGGMLTGKYDDKRNPSRQQEYQKQQMNLSEEGRMIVINSLGLAILSMQCSRIRNYQLLKKYVR